MVVWREWLPEHLAEESAREEPARFHALSLALEEDWRAQDPTAPDHEHVRLWVSIVNTFYAAKASYDSADVERIVRVALEIILNSDTDVVAQVRWATCAAKLLRRFRRTLRLEVPWRPLYDLLRRVHFSDSVSYQGAAVMESHKEALTQLIRKSRRFFPEGSAAEIWAEFRGGLQDTHQPAAFESLGWLVLLMPTLAAGRGEGDWDAWLPLWLDTWAKVMYSGYWDCLWMALLARLIKHDTTGIVRWHLHLDAIYTRIVSYFQVPVGTSSASIPIHRTAPQDCETLFGGECTSKSSTSAKIIVYLLGRCPEPGAHAMTVATEDSVASTAMRAAGGTREEVDDGVTARLDRLVDLLEQYFHPSNGGRWTSSLSRFLRHLMDYFTRRLQLDAELRQLREAGGGGEGAAALAPGARRVLPAPVQRRFVRAVLRLAGRAQYSKDNGLMDCACGVLSSAAYVAPDLVLPLVHQRFETAFETVTAAHLLVTAIHTLGLCARPLLLAGLRVSELGAPEEAPSGSYRPEMRDFEAAREIVAAALTATLPGIDANDPPKTLACYRLYCSVLSATGGFAGAAEATILPLYTEEWVEDLLGRTFAVMSNLDTDVSVGAQDTTTTAAMAANDMRGSFLLLGTSMFRPLMELLFSRLPAELQAIAIRRVSRFLVTTTLPGVTTEGSVLCNAATCANPTLAASEILAPLLEATIDELPAPRVEPKSRAMHLSSAVEGTLLWRLGLLSASLYHLGPAVLPYVSKLQVAIDRGMALVDSPRVQEATARVLSAVLGTLTSYFPTDQYAPPQELLETSMLEVWVSSTSKEPRPAWHLPSAAELKCAEGLVDKYLHAPLGELQALRGGEAGGPAPARSKAEKDELRRRLVAVEAVLHGVRTSMPDFDWGPAQGGAAGAAPLRVVGELGARLPLLAGAREKLASALLRAFEWTNEQDSDSLKAVLRTVNMTMSVGANEYNDANQSMGAWRADEQALSEAAVGGELYSGVLGELSPEAWKRHRPRWLTIERCFLHNLWRASQAAYRPWASTACLEPSLDMVPPAYRQLFSLLVSCSTNSYKGVRDTALAVLERSLKRLPCLARLAMSPMLFALAGVHAEDVPASNGESAALGNLDTVLQQLKKVAESRSAAAPSDPAAPPSNAAEEQRMEAMALGACTVLRGRACWRLAGRNPVAMAVVMRALCLSSEHTSLRSQAAINDLFLVLSLRFIRPPPLMRAQLQASVGSALPQIEELAEDLLAMAGSAASKMHWRYNLVVNTFLLFLLPVREPGLAGRLLAHFLSLLTGQILPLRQLALAAASFQVSSLGAFGADSPLGEAMTKAVADAVAAPAYASELLTNLAHNHVALTAAEAGGEAQRSRGMMSMSREEAVVKSICVTLNRFQEWPLMSKRPAVMKGGQFLILHVRSIRQLAALAPQAWGAALAAPLARALEDQSNLAEKTTVCAAAEVMAGLLASGAAFAAPAPGQPSAWEAWLRGLLRASLAGSPLELADMWGLVVRYGVGSLVQGGDDSRLTTLLELVAEPTEPGAPSSAVVKHLKVVSSALSELLTHGHTGRPAARAFQATVLQELLQLMATPLNSVRREVAKCMTLLCAARGQPGPSARGASPASPAAPRATFAEMLAREEGGAPGALEAALAGLEATLVASLAEGVPYVLRNSAPGGAGPSRMAGRAGGGEGSEGAAAGAGEGGAMEVDPPAAAAGDEHEAAVARLGTALQFVIRAMRSCHATACGDALLGCLGPLLCVQEMPDPELQPLAMEAKTAFALLKYLPLRAAQLPALLGELTAAKEKEPWHARAAALVFVQYFWFRQVFMLAGREAEGIRETVVGLLSDRKLEVQELAAATLSGILKGAPAAEGHALRGRLVAEVAALRAAGGGGRRRARARTALAPSDSAASLEALARRHAPVLGLKGFVLSTPYDVPRWLPEVLMALVSVSGEPPPIKTTVERSLGEFRRTHEEVGLQECRDYFDAEQWEAIQDVTSTASYFV
eukprot:jgi/Tetstr1/455978/TSEL_042757.t2